MLVLSRKLYEQIKIGDAITVKILEVRGGSVRLGIEAPTDVSVWRKEIWDAIQRDKVPELREEV